MAEIEGPSISKMAAAILNILLMQGWRKMDWWGIVAQWVLNNNQQSKLGVLSMYTVLMERSKTKRKTTKNAHFRAFWRPF